MSRRSFTMVEVSIGLVVLAGLVTLSVPLYRFGITGSAQAKTCETNLRVLKSALDSYAMENDVMPGDLSQLPGKYIERAFASIMSEKGAWTIKVAHFLNGQGGPGKAYAGLMTAISRGDMNLITCPADNTPPETGGVSYGMFASLAGMASIAYKNLAPGTYLIGDCDNDSFVMANQLIPRHELLCVGSVRMYANVILKSGVIVKFSKLDIIKLRQTMLKIHMSGKLKENPPITQKLESEIKQQSQYPAGKKEVVPPAVSEPAAER